MHHQANSQQRVGNEGFSDTKCIQNVYKMQTTLYEEHVVQLSLISSYNRVVAVTDNREGTDVMYLLRTQ